MRDEASHVLTNQDAIVLNLLQLIIKAITQKITPSILVEPMNLQTPQLEQRFRRAA